MAKNINDIQVDGLGLKEILSNAYDELSRSRDLLVDNEIAVGDMLISDIDSSLDRLSDVLDKLNALSKTSDYGEKSNAASNLDDEHKYNDIEHKVFTARDADKLLQSDGLQSVVMPDGYTAIHQVAFSEYEELESITIPASVKTIGEEAFAWCENLQKVIFANGSKLDSIGASAFEGCYNLEDINIPEGVTQIGDSAFAGCESLECLVLPWSTEIAETAFDNCPVEVIRFTPETSLDEERRGAKQGGIEIIEMQDTVKTYKYFLEDFNETLIVEFDEKYKKSEIKECIDSAYYDYMHPEHAEAEMEDEIENSTIDGWITDCLCNNDFHVDTWECVKGNKTMIDVGSSISDKPTLDNVISNARARSDVQDGSDRDTTINNLMK